MSILVPLAFALVAVAVLGWHFLRTPARDLVRQIYLLGGALMMLAAVGLLAVRQFALAIPLGTAGFWLIRRHRAVRKLAAPGQTSSVRTAALEMQLDHDTGEMEGTVLAGTFEGRRLSKLTLNELRNLLTEVRSDAESLRLLESYLDRAHAGWRDDREPDGSEGQRATSRAGGMSTKEAYEILGLDPDASEAEVRDAHRRLIKQVHPDRGGSAALAAKINEAKDLILGRHR